MPDVSLKELVARFSPLSQAALEAAAGLCLTREHYNVEIEHWLIKLLEIDRSDARLMLDSSGVRQTDFQQALQRNLDRLRTGNARAPALSAQLVEAMREAFMIAELEHGRSPVRSGHVILAILNSDGLRRSLGSATEHLGTVNVEELWRGFAGITDGSAEAKEPAVEGATTAPQRSEPPEATGDSPLERLTIDLTGMARDGRLDPVIGRDAEIRQIIDILTRRRQNNPILTGEAGVGKTAVVEGFAARVADEDVPPALRDCVVRSLDLGLLQAGAGVRGEFEARLRGVIDGVKSSDRPVILFIDEAHTLVGAGGQSGQNDAANLLKPALARGELRTIAATTWAEYKKYFERDAALARRFQVVKVEEPDDEGAIEMLRAAAPSFERHHGVRVLDEAISEAVYLSRRYISGRQLPDKCVGLLDTACARVAVSQSTIPAPLEACRRSLSRIEREMSRLADEHVVSEHHSERLASLEREKTDVAETLEALERRWADESACVATLAELQEQIRAMVGEDADESGKRVLSDRYVRESDRLISLQGDRPLVHPMVDRGVVADVVASWTGIPVRRMMADEIDRVMQVAERLRQRVIGQDHALTQIAEVIRTSRAGLGDPRKPIGVFLLVGTSGVGKTETALALAELLFGSEQSMTVINMAEFKEEHKVSQLMGSPPGYVGYGEGGVLTEAVRRKPFSVVLLDEIEKAHPGVQDVFYSVFDKGHLRDGEGRDIDFKNTIILMTSNAASDLITGLAGDPAVRSDPDLLLETIRPEMLKYFKPAFLGRLTMIPYLPLADADLRRIVELQMSRIDGRLRESYGARLECAPEVIEIIASRCQEVHTGARNVEYILSRTLLPRIASECIGRLAEAREIGRVCLGSDDAGGFSIEVD